MKHFLRDAKVEKMPKINIGDYKHDADIWLVNVEGRVFCRQFSSNKQGWYAAFQSNSDAILKFPSRQYHVTGTPLVFSAELSKAINHEYRRKYGFKLSPLAIVGWLMTRKKHVSKTIELKLVNSEG